jgi:hypothetical protein
MKRCLPLAIGLAALLAAPLAAEELPKYMSVLSLKLKPGKGAEFGAIARKIAEANRRNKGDNWVAYAVEFGDPWVSFVSRRDSYGEITSSDDRFRKALAEAMGPAADRTMQDAMACVEATRSELRRYRWDLSANVPENIEELNRLLGETRFVRSVAVRVKNGHGLALEEFRKRDVELLKSKDSRTVTVVTQSVLGGPAGQYYLSTLFRSLADMDSMPANRELLGEERYGEFLKMNMEHVAEAQISLYRILPAWSNPPLSVVNVSREFWIPAQRPAATAARKAKP